jgi:hypothetical protein
MQRESMFRIELRPVILAFRYKGMSALYWMAISNCNRILYLEIREEDH